MCIQKKVKRRFGWAARTIQKVWRGTLVRRELNRKDQAARRLQRWWREGRWGRVVREGIRKRRNKAIQTIQKHLMGYIDRIRIRNLAKMAKMRKDLDYFDSMREMVKDWWQLKIKYAWRRMKVNKRVNVRESERIEKEKQAMDKRRRIMKARKSMFNDLLDSQWEGKGVKIIFDLTLD